MFLNLELKKNCFRICDVEKGRISGHAIYIQFSTQLHLVHFIWLRRCSEKDARAQRTTYFLSLKLPAARARS